MQDQRLIRLDASRLSLNPPAPFPVRIFANYSVPVEITAVDELRSVIATRLSIVWRRANGRSSGSP